MTGRSRHDELRGSLDTLRDGLITFGADLGDPANLALLDAYDHLGALLDEVAAAEARAADAERERDSWERVARQYESALAERNLL